MGNNNRATSSGIGFFGILTIVFIILKLVGVITWSWIWVLSPIWIPIIIVVIVIVLIVLFTSLFNNKRKKK